MLYLRCRCKDLHLVERPCGCTTFDHGLLVHRVRVVVDSVMWMILGVVAALHLVVVDDCSHRVAVGICGNLFRTPVVVEHVVEGVQCVQEL